MAAEIQIRDLFKKYLNGTEILKGINLEIKKGQFFNLLGSNGAGKSTLVKLCNHISYFNPICIIKCKINQGVIYGKK